MEFRDGSGAVVGGAGLGVQICSGVEEDDRDVAEAGQEEGEEEA